MNQTDPPHPPPPPGDRDLVAAVADAIRRFRSDPDGAEGVALAHGVAVEVLEAATVAAVVSEWLARQPSPASACVGESLTAEATRAALAAGSGRPVPLAVRLPPLLAIRLVELAGLRGVNPERAALDLIAGAVDPAYADACRARRLPAPRPWNGRPDRAT